MLSRVDKDTWVKANHMLVKSNVEYENGSTESIWTLVLTITVDNEVVIMTSGGTAVPRVYHIDKEYFKL